MLLYINVPRMFLDGCIRPRGAAMQGPHGPIVSKDTPFAIALGPSLLQGAQAGMVGAGQGP